MWGVALHVYSCSDAVVEHGNHRSKMAEGKIDNVFQTKIWKRLSVSESSNTTKKTESWDENGTKEQRKRSCKALYDGGIQQDKGQISNEAKVSSAISD